MKYEFHVGDYVETKDGRVGYITQVAFSNEAKRWCSMRIMRRQNDFIISFEGYEDSIPDKFNRIGQYDFTKKAEDKDDDKIEPLDYTERTLRETSSGAILCAYMKKINELVDAVNELRMRDAKESKDD